MEPSEALPSRQKEWRVRDDAQLHALLRELNRGGHSSDERIEIAPEESAPVSAGDRTEEPSLDVSTRHSDSKSPQIAPERPSLGRRAIRSFARFFITVLIGVSATLAWQSYGEEAKNILRRRFPEVSWVFPVSPTQQSQSKASYVAVTAAPDLGQQLKPITL